MEAEKKLPELFETLIGLGCLEQGQIRASGDGFYAVTVSLSDLLARRGITAVPGSGEEELQCSLFFDDWFLCGVSLRQTCTYSLFKMREQEHDEAYGGRADGDTPGVTVPFIAMQTDILLQCLTDPTHDRKLALSREIDRVVARAGQRHSLPLKEYFVRDEARAPYLIAEMYTELIASFAREGAVPVPDRYAADYSARGLKGRIPRFIQANNAAAGRTVCDHKTIYIRDPGCLTEQERLAILATHTGNTSLYSFAAEVQFHARMLVWWAKLRIPLVGWSAYASAIRADMSIADAEFTGPAPYYHSNSRMVRRQYRCHKGRVERA